MIRLKSRSAASCGDKDEISCGAFVARPAAGALERGGGGALSRSRIKNAPTAASTIPKPPATVHGVTNASREEDTTGAFFGVPPLKDAPHSGQKRDLGGASAPHALQTEPSGSPHWLQNFPSASAPHFGQLARLDVTLSTCPRPPTACTRWVPCRPALVSTSERPPARERRAETRHKSTSAASGSRSLLRSKTLFVLRRNRDRSKRHQARERQSCSPNSRWPHPLCSPPKEVSRLHLPSDRPTRRHRRLFHAWSLVRPSSP